MPRKMPRWASIFEEGFAGGILILHCALFIFFILMPILDELSFTENNSFHQSFFRMKTDSPHSGLRLLSEAISPHIRVILVNDSRKSLTYRLII